MPEPGTVIKRPRKPRPRHPEVVIAAIQERINSITRDESNEWHFSRLDELMNELQRAINGKFDEEAE